MKKVLLAGNAITADILFSYLQNDSRYEVVALTVDDDFLTKRGNIDEVESVGLSQLRKNYPPENYTVIMAVGYDDLNRVRESLFSRLKEMGYIFETYIHPDARVYTAYPLGEGCVVLPGAVIEPHVQVGANTIIWCNVTLAHHSNVGINCWIASGTVLSGQTRILRNSFIGVNVTVVNQVTVGEYNVIGAGALITKDTKTKSVFLARSAEPFRYSSDDYVKYFGV